MLIPLARLVADPAPARKVFDHDADSALVRSLEEAGQLEPILVVPAEGDRFAVVNGNRRLRMAARAGLDALEAFVLPKADAAYIAGAALAANTLHAQLAPVDQWRALVAMQEAGHTLASAAAWCGVSERRAEQLARLGRLAPELLALVERHGQPLERELRILAAAPLDMQRKAVKAHPKRRDGAVNVNWPSIVAMCKRTTYSRSLAIFDLERVKVTWQFDAFAQPDSPEEWTTADGVRFLDAQAAALADLAAASGGKLAKVGESARYPGNPDFPKGWRPNQGNPDKPKRHEVVYACVSSLTGAVVKATAIDQAAERKAAKAKEAKATAERTEREAPATLERQRAKLSPALSEIPSDLSPPAAAATPEADAIAPAAEPKTGITKEGQAILARMKSAALRKRLVERVNDLALADLCAFFVLAVQGRNVAVRVDQTTGETAAELAHGLVAPAGAITPLVAEIRDAAVASLAFLLEISEPNAPGYRPGSGPVAEWIGAAIGAGEALERCDTPEFLAACQADTLRDACEAAEIKFSSVAQARRDLAGNAPSWRPTAAHFGAPGPRQAAREAA